MNADQATNYRYLIREISMIDDQIKYLTTQYNKPHFQEALSSLLLSLESHKAKCLKESQAFENWIVAIPDKCMQHIMFSRFVEGLTWCDVAGKVGGTVDSVKKSAQRYFDKEAYHED